MEAVTPHVTTFLNETIEIANQIDQGDIDCLAYEFETLRERNGTLYLIGLGGSAANCAHAASDFRRLCGMKAKALVESVPELTAVSNDDGWDNIFCWHLWHYATSRDALLIFSVGGGADGVSTPINEAIATAKTIGMTVYGVVGRNGGFTKEFGDRVVLVPTVSAERVTPHTEAWQMVITHLLVSHPVLQKQKTKW